MIKITIEDTETGRKKQRLFEVKSNHSFSEAADFVIGLLGGFEGQAGASRTRPKNDIMDQMQSEYTSWCGFRGIVDHESDEAKELQRQLYQSYIERVDQAEREAESSYEDRANFYRKLKTVRLPRIKLIMCAPTWDQVIEEDKE